MCDTMVALPAATRDGVTLFAKNSDREPNEAQVVERHRAREPGADHVECTYVSVPEVDRPHEVLLSRPTWMFGAEMGANEHGLVIGNEAVFTREPYADTGLLGMDLLRLTLERARSAEQGVTVLTDLLEAHGQGGDHGPFGEFRYHNSYLLADEREAWILETAGEWWAAVCVERGVASISNGLTIADPDRASDGLREYAVEAGYWDGEGQFDFATAYGDPVRTRVSRCRRRQARSRQLLSRWAGDLTEVDLMGVLRDHGTDEPSLTDRLRSLVDGDAPPASLGSICMHAGGLFSDQSTGSMVSRIGDAPTHWLTGTSAPCTGIFKPFYLGAGEVPTQGDPETGSADGSSLWWRHERLHRAVLRNYGPRLAAYRDERDAMESGFLEAARDVGPGERGAFMHDCFERADAALSEWRAAAESVPAREWTRPLFGRRWREENEYAGLEVG